MEKLLLYSPELNARLEYVVNILFQQVLGISYELTHFSEEYDHYEGPKLCYDFEAKGKSHFLQASGLLFERGIMDQSEKIGNVDRWEKLPIFFNTSKDSLLPFDLFSASFYLLSRYEEYLPFSPDQHGRFPAKESIAFKNNFLQLPLVQLWAKKLETILFQLFPTLDTDKTLSFSIEATVDIDNAYAIKNKGLRSLAHVLIPKGSMEERNYKYQVFRGKQPDPYDQYNFLCYQFNKHQLEPIFFFLVGKRGPYDRNLSPKNKEFKRIIRDLNTRSEVGIHPSYSSNFSADSLAAEKETLEKIIGTTITSSRQHFLLLRFPETYNNLLAHGIRDDYSLGYADAIGFRSSIALPHPFFNLEKNIITELMLHPFQVMDVALKDYEKLEPKEATLRVQELIDEVKKTGGTFSFLWHNESLSEWKEWTAWSRVFTEMLAYATES